MIKHYSAILAVCGFSATAAFAQPTIERIAPPNSVVVAGIGSTGRTLEQFKQTALWKLWCSKGVQDQVKEPLEEFQDELTQALHELGIEEEEGEQKGLPTPQGPMGLAIFPAAGAMAGGDEEEEHSPVGYMVMADYGSEAPRMGRIVEALLEKARKDGVEVREQEVLGRTVYTFDLSAPEAGKAFGVQQGGEENRAGDEEGGMGDFEAMMPVPVPDAEEFFQALGHVRYCRDGSRFLVCSDPEVLHKALELIDEEGHSGLEAREDFQAAMRQLGPNDGYALLLMRDLWEGLMPPGDPTAMMMQGMIKSVLGDIRALGLGVRVGTGDVMMEDTFAVYMPAGKTGLSGLVDVETPQGTLPPFVGPQTVVYGRANVRFGGVMAFLRGVAQSNPLMGPEINRMLVEKGPMIERVCAALGPKVHSIAALSRPIQLDSLKSMYAIECGKPADVDSVLAQNAADWGLHPRDFMGNRIYSMEINDMPMPMAGPFAGDGTISIGLGGGHMFIGAASMVEDALRAAARKGGPSLADDPEFKRAQRALKAQRSVSWGMINLVSYLEFIKGVQESSMKQAIEQARQWDPEYARQLDGQGPAWGGFDVKLLGRYLGPLCWEVRSLENGFSGRYLLLPPATPPPDEKNAGAGN